MTRLMSKRELADALGVDGQEVDQWIAEGCPCFGIRQGLLLFDEHQVRAWSYSRKLEAILPLLERLQTASTAAEVIEIAIELPRLVAHGLVTEDGARVVRRHLTRLAWKLAEEREQP